MNYFLQVLAEIDELELDEEKQFAVINAEDLNLALDIVRPGKIQSERLFKD